MSQIPTSLAEVDSAIAGAKARYDYADAPHNPDVLALIRAAEAMRAALDSDNGRLVVLSMPADDWSQIVTNLEKFCGMAGEDIEILSQVDVIRE